MIKCIIDNNDKTATIYINGGLEDVMSFEDSLFKKDENEEITAYNILQMISKLSMHIKLNYNAKEERTVLVIDDKYTYSILKPNGEIISKLTKSMKKKIQDNELKLLLGSVLYELSMMKDYEIELISENSDEDNEKEGDNQMEVKNNEEEFTFEDNDNEEVLNNSLSFNKINQSESYSFKSMNRKNAVSDKEIDFSDNAESFTFTNDDTFTFEDDSEDNSSGDYSFCSDEEIKMDDSYGFESYSFDDNYSSIYTDKVDNPENNDFENEFAYPESETSNVENETFNIYGSADISEINEYEKHSSGSVSVDFESNCKEDSFEDNYNCDNKEYLGDFTDNNIEHFDSMSTGEDFESESTNIEDTDNSNIISKEDNISCTEEVLENDSYISEDDIKVENNTDISEGDNLEFNSSMSMSISVDNVDDEFKTLSKLLDDKIQTLKIELERIEKENSPYKLDVNDLSITEEELLENFKKSMEMRLRLKVIKKSFTIYSNLKEKLNEELNKQ